MKHFTSVFYFKISFVNSKHENSNSKEDFVFKTSFERSYSRFLVYKNKSDSDLVFNGLAFKIQNSLHTQHTFFASNCIWLNKSKSKIYYLLLDLEIDNICRIKPPLFAFFLTMVFIYLHKLRLLKNKDHLKNLL